MNWININTKDMKHPLMVRSDAVQRGAWLSMVCYCTERETGGYSIKPAKATADHTYKVRLPRKK